MASELSQYGSGGNLSEPLVKAALEAAAEMKCVALKVALARCYEILAIADINEQKPAVAEVFLKEVLELIK